MRSLEQTGKGTGQAWVGLNQCRCSGGADAQRLFRSRIGDDLEEHTREQSNRIGEQLLVGTPIKNRLASGVIRDRQAELGGIRNVNASDSNRFTSVEADDAIDTFSKGHGEDALGNQNSRFRGRKQRVLAQNFADGNRFRLRNCSDNNCRGCRGRSNRRRGCDLSSVAQELRHRGRVLKAKRFKTCLATSQIESGTAESGINLRLVVLLS